MSVDGDDHPHSANSAEDSEAPHVHQGTGNANANPKAEEENDEVPPLPFSPEGLGMSQNVSSDSSIPGMFLA